MRNLVVILFAALASAGAVHWQQEALGRSRASRDALAAQVAQTRKSIEVDEAALETARALLRELTSNAQGKKAAQVLADAQPMPTPDQEGWWPTNRAYFYLAKARLPLARFRDHTMTHEEMDDSTRSSLAKEGMHEATVSNQLIQDGKLSPLMALLLGMTDQEFASANQLLSDLVSEVRRLEAARIERVEPPQPINDYQLIVAKIPSLASELTPIKEQISQLLTGLLGAQRTQILDRQFEDHANEHLDGLASLPRDFLRDRTRMNLWVRYHHHEWGESTGGAYYLPNYHSDCAGSLEYGHLFGHGGPCELK